MTILLVDDDPSARALARMFLAKAGFEVVEAAGGTEALAAVEAARPTLVLLDYNMPGLNGPEVARRLRAAPATADLPIVMLTVSGSPEHIEEALSAGADDYLIKPVDRNLLVARVKAALRAHAEQARVHEALAGLRQRDALVDELEEARRVQEALLPVLPRRFPGTLVTGTVVSLGHVAGDMLDVTGGEDGMRYASVIDVSGHGTAAALVAATVLTTLRMMTATRPLVEALQAAHQQIGNSVSGKYACVAAVQLEGRRATLVNAGLPPVGLVRAGRLIDTVVASAQPLGLMPTLDVETRVFDLEPGDRIIMVSDGLTEPFGHADALEVCLTRLGLLDQASVRDLPPAQLEARIRAALRDATPGDEDDATILILAVE